MVKKKNKGIKIIVALLILVLFVSVGIKMYFHYKTPKDVSLKIHYYKDGLDVTNTIEQTWISPPGGDFDAIGFSIVVSNFGDITIENLHIVSNSNDVCDSSSCEVSLGINDFSNPVAKILNIGETKTLWTSNQIDAAQYEGYSVIFDISISGENNYGDVIIITGKSGSIEFISSGVTPFSNKKLDLFLMEVFGGGYGSSVSKLIINDAYTNCEFRPPVGEVWLITDMGSTNSYAEFYDSRTNMAMNYGYMYGSAREHTEHRIFLTHDFYFRDNKCKKIWITGQRYEAESISGIYKSSGYCEIRPPTGETWLITGWDEFSDGNYLIKDTATGNTEDITLIQVYSQHDNMRIFIDHNFYIYSYNCASPITISGIKLD